MCVLYIQTSQRAGEVKHSSHSKSHHKHSHKKHKHKSDKDKDSKLEKLRRERLKREEAEKAKSEAVLKRHYGVSQDSEQSGATSELQHSERTRK